MTFDRQESTGYVVNYLTRLFTRALARRTRAHGVSIGQFPVLLALWEAEGATQTQLAEQLTIEQPTMANTLKRMERDGLIRRVPDADDNRQARIHLTARGKHLEEALTTCAREVNALALATLGRREREQFLALARRVAQNLERDSAGR